MTRIRKRHRDESLLLCESERERERGGGAPVDRYENAYVSIGYVESLILLFMEFVQLFRLEVFQSAVSRVNSRSAEYNM